MWLITMDGLKRKRNALLAECSFSPPPPRPTNNKIKPITIGRVEISAVGVTTINNLPEALLIEILIQIPAKSAHQYKSVCKFWNSLISNPHFGSQFIRRNKPSSSSINSSSLSPLIFSHWSGIFKTSFDGAVRMEHFVHGSSGGLLLCCKNEYYPFDYYVCNPVTMNLVKLPQPPQLRRISHTGFICDPSNNRFTVARIPVAAEGELKSFRMEIFSSETGQWSNTDVSCPPRFLLDIGTHVTSVVCNGILHFLCLPSSIFAYNPYDHGGADEERFRFIDLPADVVNANNLHIGTSRGRLLLSCKLIFFTWVVREVPFMVWELKDYNTGHWSLAHKVSMGKMVLNSCIDMDELSLCTWSPRVIAFDTNNSDVLYVLSGPSTIVLCNVRRMTMKLMAGTPDFGNSRSVRVFPVDLPCWPTPIPTFPRNGLGH